MTSQVDRNDITESPQGLGDFCEPRRPVMSEQTVYDHKDLAVLPFQIAPPDTDAVVGERFEGASGVSETMRAVKIEFVFVIGDATLHEVLLRSVGAPTLTLSP
jgi:hypothetical protein